MKSNEGDREQRYSQRIKTVGEGLEKKKTKKEKNSTNRTGFPHRKPENTSWTG